jgi:hypothetical protein
MPATKPKPRNRWDDPKAIRRKGFAQGHVGLGMSPAESFTETLFCHQFVAAYNRKRNRAHECIHHIRIDQKGLKIPDISFWDLHNNVAEVVVEVDEQKSKAGAVRKAKNAIEKHGVVEAFVYCIDTGNWYGMYRGADGKASAPEPGAWSGILKIDLAKILDK